MREKREKKKERKECIRKLYVFMCLRIRIYGMYENDICSYLHTGYRWEDRRLQNDCFRMGEAMKWLGWCVTSQYNAQGKSKRGKIYDECTPFLIMCIPFKNVFREWSGTDKRWGILCKDG